MCQYDKVVICAVYKKIVPHMRISERHFELPIIETCRSNFREFLCRRNFPVGHSTSLLSKTPHPNTQQ